MESNHNVLMNEKCVLLGIEEDELTEELDYMCKTELEYNEFKTKYATRRTENLVNSITPFIWEYRKDRLLNGVGQDVTTVSEVNNLLQKKKFNEASEKLSELFQQPISVGQVKTLNNRIKLGLDLNLIFSLHSKKEFIDISLMELLITYKSLVGQSENIKLQNIAI